MSLHTQYGNVNAPGLENRLTNQANRINQGLTSGAMSSGGAQQLQGEYQTFRSQLAADKVSGGVNGQERQALQQQMTGISTDIYNLKHGGS